MAQYNPMKNPFILDWKNPMPKILSIHVRNEINPYVYRETCQNGKHLENAIEK